MLQGTRVALLSGRFLLNDRDRTLKRNPHFLRLDLKNATGGNPLFGRANSLESGNWPPNPTILRMPGGEVTPSATSTRIETI